MAERVSFLNTIHQLGQRVTHFFGLDPDSLREARVLSARDAQRAETGEFERVRHAETGDFVAVNPEEVLIVRRRNALEDENAHNTVVNNHGSRSQI